MLGSCAEGISSKAAGVMLVLALTEPAAADC